MPEVTEKFEQWAILELMGHRRLAGLVTEQVIAGKGFIRIDVYQGDKYTSQFYSPEAVYAITPTTEEIAKHLAAKIIAAPINSWELQGLKRIGAQEENDDTGPDDMCGDGDEELLL